MNYRLGRFSDAIKRTVRVNVPLGDASLISTIEQFMPVGDSEYELYQTYFENCLRERVRLTNTNAAGNFTKHATHVGQYRFKLKGGTVVKVAIDAHDHRNIRSQKIHDWSDVYFKVNYWKTCDYGPKVYELVTGNSAHSLEKVRFLKKLRQTPKDIDFIFVGRIWAGGDANREHNLRLFEQVAKIQCNSKIIAVHAGFDADPTDYEACKKRLDAVGLEFTSRQLSYIELMTLSARAKCTVLRAGISSCIPWRMTDMLAIGACLVLDCPPFPRCPVPLKENQNFLSLDLRISEDCKPAPAEQYFRIAEKMNRYLCDHELQLKICINNARYFDEHVHPLRVSSYILKIVNSNLSKLGAV